MRALSSFSGLPAIATLMLVVPAAASVVGCGHDSGAHERAAPAALGASDAAVTGEAADRTSSTSTFFVVTARDTRRCASPACGGVFVKRVNLPDTVCADGMPAAQCHVAHVDLTGTKLNADEMAGFRGRFEQSRAIVRGAIIARREGALTVATLMATEAWVGNALKDYSGEFFRVTDLGIRCFTYPCESFHEAQLNTSQYANIAGVDIATTGAEPALIANGNKALFASGLIVAGTHREVTGPAGTSQELAASEFYTRFTHTPEDGAPCGGFAGVACGPSQFCDVAVPDACNGADLPGRCRAVAARCIESVEPVCGCDRRTYGNDCQRQTAQVQLAHAGACVTR